jgi:4-hydroxybenzoate polyprenyltransferase
MSNNHKPDASVINSNEKGPSLSQQYGGIHTGTWIDYLPRSWIPYVQLARLSPTVALLLIYLPHLFGILHTAVAYRQEPQHVLQISVKLLGGSFFFSNAAHAWNDLIDAPIDSLVTRTKDRPIVRGDITRRAGLTFAIIQGLLASSFLLMLPQPTIIATVPTIISTTYYPWAKRHTYFPQVVLGFCLAWGTIVGSAAANMQQPWRDPALLCLVLVSALWTIIFDSVYAHQDVEDDIKIGVKSTAVLFGHHTKKFLWVCLALMCVCIVAYGNLAAFGRGYYLITFGGCLVSLAAMIAQVDLSDKANCWWWFASDFWLTAASILGGLLFEYLQQYFTESGHWGYSLELGKFPKFLRRTIFEKGICLQVNHLFTDN